MQKVIDYLKMLRVKHYVKNLLIVIPLFFSGDLFSFDKIFNAVFGIVCFCLISSSVYILNDIQDIEKDRLHPTKKNRPIASGRVSKNAAIIFLVGSIVSAGLLSIIFLPSKSLSILALYFIINIMYSMGLKNKPIIDIMILTSGFVLRIIYGGILTDVEISNWLYLVVISGSLYMGLGKRRNELVQRGDTRKVLKFYTEAFLDKNMYVCVALVNVFYALWSIDVDSQYMVWTVPVFMVILMKYSLDVEGESDGDPVEVLMHDKMLIIMACLYAILLFLLLYVI